MTELVKYEEARRLLAEAVAVDEVQAIRNRAEAMRAYAKQARDRDLELNAAELRIRAERRLGQLIILQRETVGLNRGGNPKSTAERPPTLEDVGIDRKLSSRAQRMAIIDDVRFERQIVTWRREQVGLRVISSRFNGRRGRRPPKILTSASEFDRVLLDGRVLGDICFGEIERLVQMRLEEARVLSCVSGHVASPAPDMTVRDAVPATILASFLHEGSA